MGNAKEPPCRTPGLRENMQGRTTVEWGLPPDTGGQTSVSKMEFHPLDSRDVGRFSQTDAGL